MSTPTLDLNLADFDPLPDQPLRTARFWLGKAVALPLCLALAVVYVLTDPE